MAVSHIMLEAYKKYILVSLILHGKVQQLPKYTSQIVGRFIKVQMAQHGFNHEPRKHSHCFSVCFLVIMKKILSTKYDKCVISGTCKISI